MNGRSIVKHISKAFFAASWFPLFNIAHITFFRASGRASGLRYPIVYACIFAVIIYLVCGLIKDRGCNRSVLLSLCGVFAVIATVGIQMLTPGFFLAERIVTLFLSFGGFLLAGSACFTDLQVPRMLSQIDALVLAVFWNTLFAQSAYGDVNDIVPALLVLGFGIIALVLLRSVGDSDEVLWVSPLSGSIMLGAIALALTALLFAILRLFSDGARSALQYGINTVVGGLKWLYGQFYRFMAWLASLLPEQVPEEPVTLEPPPAAIENDEVVSTVAMDGLVRILIAVLIIAAVVILVLFVRYLIKHRAERIHGEHVEREEKNEHAKRWKMNNRFAQRLKELMFNIRFRIHFLLHRKEATAVLVYLERVGKKLKCDRAPGESYRSFFHRLLEFVQDADAKEKAAGDLTVLADCLDKLFFGNIKTEIAGSTVRSIRQCFGAVSVQEKRDDKEQNQIIE